MKGSSVLRAAMGIGLVTAIILAVVFHAEVFEGLNRFLDWVKSIGIWGPVVVAVVYVFACVFLLPGSVLTIGAGFLFGLGVGYVTVTVGSVVGACAAFLVGRYLTRDFIEKKIEGNAKFAAISTAVEQKGFLIVLLTRLSPVFPFNLLNYGYGLTRVSFRDYSLASLVGMIPGTLVYVYVGTAVSNVAEFFDETREKTWQEKAFFWGGLVVTLIVTTIVTRVAKKALADAVPAEAEADGGDRPAPAGE